MSLNKLLLNQTIRWEFSCFPTKKSGNLPAPVSFFFLPFPVRKCATSYQRLVFPYMDWILSLLSFSSIWLLWPSPLSHVIYQSFTIRWFHLVYSPIWYHSKTTNFPGPYIPFQILPHFPSLPYLLASHLLTHSNLIFISTVQWFLTKSMAF